MLKQRTWAYLAVQQLDLFNIMINFIKLNVQLLNLSLPVYCSGEDLPCFEGRAVMLVLVFKEQLAVITLGVCIGITAGYQSLFEFNLHCSLMWKSTLTFDILSKHPFF